MKIISIFNHVILLPKNFITMPDSDRLIFLYFISYLLILFNQPFHSRFIFINFIFLDVFIFKDVIYFFIIRDEQFVM